MIMPWTLPCDLPIKPLPGTHDEKYSLALVLRSAWSNLSEGHASDALLQPLTAYCAGPGELMPTDSWLARGP